jgi:vacuolar-type H+-ATPase subunit F/Vma7
LTSKLNSNSDHNKIAIIADQSTVTAFQLAGVKISKVIEKRSARHELEKSMKEILTDGIVRFILISEPLVEEFGLDHFEKIRRSIPDDVLLLIIPDRLGSREKIGEGHLYHIIRRAIGARREIN